MTHVLTFCIIRGNYHVQSQGCGSPIILHADDNLSTRASANDGCRRVSVRVGGTLPRETDFRKAHFIDGT